MMKTMMALALLAAALLALPPADVAQADGYRYSHNYAKRGYRSPMRYYRNRCTYGDCICIRQIALATGSPVWWDRYQACTG
jgi:hypothetical protein